MQTLAHLIGQPAQLDQTRVREEREPVGEGKRLAVAQLAGDRRQAHSSRTFPSGRRSHGANPAARSSGRRLVAGQLLARRRARPGGARAAATMLPMISSAPNDRQSWPSLCPRTLEVDHDVRPRKGRPARGEERDGIEPLRLAHWRGNEQDALARASSARGQARAAVFLGLAEGVGHLDEAAGLEVDGVGGAEPRAVGLAAADRREEATAAEGLRGPAPSARAPGPKMSSSAATAHGDCPQRGESEAAMPSWSSTRATTVSTTASTVPGRV